MAAWLGWLGIPETVNTLLGYDDVFLQHRTGDHPERPARLTAIGERLKRSGLADRCLPVPQRVDPDHWIATVHSAQYIDRLAAACDSSLPFIDVPDSAICSDSLNVARQAVAVVLAACDMIVDQRAENGFCPVRPPGHHAERDRSLGFCLFNNVAIAGRYLQQEHKIPRVFILDWDVHHGNGTQHTFESDDTVFYCSLHQHPATCYPGTGWPGEIGLGPGRGTTLNLALEPGTGDQECLELFRTVVLTAARDFRPDFILISAGFDAHRKDPLAQLELSEYAFDQMTSEIKQLAQTFCRGRLLSVLEGGYHLGALANCVANHVEILLQ